MGLTKRESIQEIQLWEGALVKYTEIKVMMEHPVHGRYVIQLPEELLPVYQVHTEREGLSPEEATNQLGEFMQRLGRGDIPTGCEPIYDWLEKFMEKFDQEIDTSFLDEYEEDDEG